MRDIGRSIRASIVAILVSTALVTGWLALPQSVAACSCADPSLAAFAKLPDVAIFSGTVQATDPTSLQVTVDRWFHGTGMAPIVHLDPAGFGNHGESCQIAPPPPGSRWLFAAGRAPATGLVQINLCSLSGDLSTADGRALLAAAVKAFPNAVVPPPPTNQQPSPPPVAATAPPSASGSTTPSSPSAEVAPFLALGAIVLLAAGLVVLIVLIGRRPRAQD